MDLLRARMRYLVAMDDQTAEAPSPWDPGALEPRGPDAQLGICPGGRAFRDATGTPSVARIASRADWLRSVDGLDVDDLDEATRLSHAEHWMNEAAFEHASVASFAQLTLDLMAVGAPPELLEGAQHAALDEIEHAKIAYALASRYGGSAIGPASLQARPGANRTLAEIARTTFIDACLGESVAAAALAESARDTSDTVLEALLTKMAAAKQPDVDPTSPDARLRLLRASVLREVVIPCVVSALGSVSSAPRDVRRYATS